MSVGGAPAPFSSGRDYRLFAAATGVATCQIALGWRLASEEYWVTMSAAWMAVLILAWQEPSLPAIAVRAGWRVLGVIAAVAAVVPMAVSSTYGSLDRVLPLAAGAGIVLATFGPAGWPRQRRALLLLALPLLNPVAKGIRFPLIDPWLLPLTTWSAMAIGRAAGLAIGADGRFLRFPNDSLEVWDACSGLLAMTRLLVLAALVFALFETTVRERVALVGSALAIGFLSNAVRIAVLGREVLRKDDAAFDYWHEGSGATLFTIAATAAAGLVWWLMLRPSRPSSAGPTGMTRDAPSLMGTSPLR